MSGSLSGLQDPISVINHGYICNLPLHFFLFQIVMPVSFRTSGDCISQSQNKFVLCQNHSTLSDNNSHSADIILYVECESLTVLVLSLTKDNFAQECIFVLH